MKHMISTIGASLARMRGRLIIAFVLLIGAYFVVAFGEQAWKARQLQAEVAERQSVVAQLQSQKKSMQEQLNAYASDQYLAYVESAARRDLNLSRPGETVLLVRWQNAPTPTPAPQAAASPQPQHEANWSKWLNLFGHH